MSLGSDHETTPDRGVSRRTMLKGAAAAGTVAWAAPALVSLTATAAAASGIGAGFVVPIGSTVTFSNITIGGDDANTLGYILNGGPEVPLGTDGPPYGQPFPGDSAPNVTIGPFGAVTTVLIYLEDTGPFGNGACDDTFVSNGNHALVTGSNPYDVYIHDAALCSCDASCARPPTAGTDGYEGHVTVTIS
jgi:hypothetical protein